MGFSTWGEAIILSLQNAWMKFVSFLPEIIGALIVLVIGLIVSSMLGKIAKKIFSYTKIDKMLEGTPLTKHLEEVGVKFSFAGLIGWIVKWFFIVVFLIAVADILNWQQINTFLSDIALYIPKVIVAILIMAIGLLVGNFVYRVVEKSVQVSKFSQSSGGFLASLAKWAIIIFSSLAALVQLGIASRLIEILFTGLVGMLSLAGALAFGLGGRDKAKEWIEKLDKEIKGE